jgi:hypothetical protein
VERAKNRTKSTVLSKVEHVFAVMKLKFGFVKLRLSRTEEECYSTVRSMRAGESIPAAEEVAAGTKPSPAAKVADHERATEAGHDGKERIRTLALAWLNTQHLKSRLIQSFPSAPTVAQYL